MGSQQVVAGSSPFRSCDCATRETLARVAAIAMGLREPFELYRASSNLEAQMLVDFLESKGVETWLDEDQSHIGTGVFGNLPQVVKPLVWVERERAEDAARLVQDFEAMHLKPEEVIAGDGSIKVECHDCRLVTEFPASAVGTVQTCPRCRAYLDVGELDWEEQDFGEPEE